MHHLTTVLSELSRFHGVPCVSLFLHATPADAAGQHARLNALIRDAELQLLERGLRGDEVGHLIEPIRRMMAVHGMSFPAGGSAVFSAPGYARRLVVRNPVIDGVSVDEVFRVRPLLDEPSTRFLLLALHHDHVRAHTCDATGLAPAGLRLPTRGEAIADGLIRNDDPEGKAALGCIPAGMCGDNDRTTQAYFRLIANTLRVARPAGSDQVLLAGTGRHRALFSQAADGRLAILHQQVEIDQDCVDANTFRARALKVAAAASPDALESTVTRLLRCTQPGLIQDEAARIVEDSAAGCIDVLLIARGSHAWGTPWRGGQVRIRHGERQPGDVDHLDRAAVEVIRHGGVAYQVGARRLAPGQRAVALLRWPSDRYAAVGAEG
jgi:hypothetical protein